MITTIIFDLSEVYLRGSKGVDEYLQQHHNLPLVYKPLLIPEINDLFHGKITEEGYWRIIVDKYNLAVSVDELKKIVRNNFQEIKGTRDIIEQLREKGYKLGLLSVHAREWVDYCEKKYDYHKLFDSILYSFEVEVSKPDKKAYKFMLNKLNTTPEECLLIDDSLTNITAARQLNITTIQFQSAQQLIEDLNVLGIIL